MDTVNSYGFSSEELARYSRHLIIPEFNIAGQQKLKEASVLVIGAGGLGSPLLLYLAAAGVGTIGILDFDRVDRSNLQRQVIYDEGVVGVDKVSAARERILALNPHINIHTHDVHLTSENALDIIRAYDVIADGTDNFPTRYLVNDACQILGKPLVYGSIFQFEGQVSVFNAPGEDGQRGPTYRDLFPTPPPPGMVPSCAEGGVLGVLPGIIGSLQANEVIKLIAGIGESLSGRLFIFDALTFTSVTLNIQKNASLEPVTELIDYEAFCGVTPDTEEDTIPSISVRQLSQMIRENADFQLIDVRLPYEYDIVNLGGLLIPQDELEEQLEKIATDRRVVVHCRTGKRSADVVETLRSKHNYKQVFNLEGGILQYAREIDPEMPTY